VVVLILFLLIFVLFWLSSASWEGHLLQEVAAAPALNDEFDALSTTKEMFSLSENQNVLFRNGMDFSLVSNVANSLLAVVIIYNTMLYALAVTIRRTFLVLNRISFVIGNLASTDSLLVDVTSESHFNVFVHANTLSSLMRSLR